MEIDLTQLIIALLGVLGVVLTRYACPWIKSHCSASSLAYLVQAADVAVRAAQELDICGKLSGTKADYALKAVKTALAVKGITYDDATIATAVKAAVVDLRLDFDFQQRKIKRASGRDGGDSKMITRYSLSRQGAVALGPHFKVSEFACHDGSDTILIDSQLVQLLEKIRTHFGLPVNVSSAYRSPSWNASHGGAQRSYHMRGMAADIYIRGIAPIIIAQYAESIGVKGIGLYVYPGGNFVHVDTRSNKYFWKQTSKTSHYFTVSSFKAA